MRKKIKWSTILAGGGRRCRERESERMLLPRPLAMTDFKKL